MPFKKFDSNKIFQFLFTESANPMILYNRDTLKIVDANESAISFYGYSKAEFRKKKITFLHPKEELHKLNEYLKETNEAEKRVNNWKHILKDGRIVEVEVISNKLKIENEVYRLIQIIDRTQVKWELDKLKYNEELFSSVIEDLRTPILIADLSNVRSKLASLKIMNSREVEEYLSTNESVMENILEDLEILFVNKAVVFQYRTDSKEDFINQVGSFFNCNSKKGKVQFLISIIENHQESKVQTTLKTLEGKQYYALINWHPMLGYESNFKRVFFSINDVTSVRIAELTIKRLENRFKALFNSSEIGIAILDKNRRFIEANQALSLSIGYSNDEFKNMKIEDILVSKNENRAQIMFEGLFEEYSTSIKLEERILCKNQNISWLKFTISRIKEEESSSNFAIAIIEDITVTRKKEEERDQLFRINNDAQERLRYLSKSLIEIQEKERGVIARELHDEIGQVLTAIKIEMQSVALSKKEIKNQEHLDEGIELVEYAISKVRDLSINLRPSMLDDLGLIPALRWFIDKQAQRGKISMKFHDGTISKRYSSEIEITVYRVVQEALTNILRHAKAKSVKIDILEIPESLFLKIEDDGKGFSVEEAKKKAREGTSMGIMGMVERVELVGGKLIYNSSPANNQTIITATFPLT